MKGTLSFLWGVIGFALGFLLSALALSARAIGPAGRLDALKALLSWPFMGFLVVVLILWRLGAALESFIKGIRKVQLPNGSTIDSQPSEPVGSDGKPGSSGDGAAASPSNLWISPFLQSVGAWIKDKDKLIEELTGLAAYWELQYLNVFLVPTTKLILMWFYKLGRTDTATYNKSWESVNDEQRRITLAVLLQHQLLEPVEVDSYRITRRGWSFLGFIGWLSPSSHAPE